MIVSVIIVTFNSSSVIDRCFDALRLSQLANSMEIIVVDNGSTDTTVTKLKSYQGTQMPFESFRVIYLATNHGYARANNVGFKYSNGDYVLLLNPDAFVQRDTISGCLEKLVENPRAGAIGCRLTLANGKIDKACRRSLPTIITSAYRLSGLSLLFPRSRFAQYNLTYLDDYGTYPVGSVSGAFLLTTRVAYLKAGGLDEAFFMYGEDLAYCNRMHKIGLEVWYDGVHCAVHLKGANGGKKTAASLFFFYRAMYIYYRKYSKSTAAGLIAVNLVTIVLFCLHLVSDSLRKLVGFLSRQGRVESGVEHNDLSY